MPQVLVGGLLPVMPIMFCMPPMPSLSSSASMWKTDLSRGTARRPHLVQGLQKSYGQQLWRCPCNVPWSECQQHKTYPQQAPDDSTYRQRPPKRNRSANFVEAQGPARNVQQRLDAPPHNCTARQPREQTVSLDLYSQAGPVANPRLWGEKP